MVRLVVVSDGESAAWSRLEGDPAAVAVHRGRGRVTLDDAVPVEPVRF